MKLTRRVLIEKFGFQEIGTYVRIRNVGNSYSNFHYKFHEMGFKNPTEERSIDEFYVKKFLNITLNDNSFQIINKALEGMRFKIFSKSEHPSSGELLFGIKDKYGNEFLFSEEGLIFY